MGRVIRQRLGDAEPLETGNPQHVEDQDTVIGHHGTAGFRDDGGMGDSGLVTDRLEAEDDIVGILLEGVVHRGLEAGPGAVIVDPQAPTHIQHLQAGAGLDQLRVDLAPPR